MTRHRIVCIHDNGVEYFDFGQDTTKAEKVEFEIRGNDKNIRSVTIGDYDGEEFIVVLHRVKEVKQ